MAWSFIYLVVGGLNYQGLSGTLRMFSGDNRPEPTLTMIIPYLNITWKRFSYDSVQYLAPDTGYESVSRLANEAWWGMGFSCKYYEVSVAAPLKNDLWNGKFGQDINTHMSTSLGDIFINNKGSYPFRLLDFPGAVGLVWRYSFPVAPGEWDPSQSRDTSSLGVSYSGGVWRLLGYGSNSSYWGIAGTYVPLDLFGFTLNLGLSSNRNGDPTDNTFEWGFSLDIRTGNYEPFVEYYSTSFVSDTLPMHGNAPQYWTLGIRTEASGGAGVFLGLDFWQRNRGDTRDNRQRPDFWLASWAPDWDIWFGVSYAYHIKKEKKAAKGPVGVVWGTVFDKETNQPTKALVSVPEAKVNRQPTDNAGVFRIEDVPGGKATLVVEAPGKELYTETISVKPDGTTYKNVFLSSKAGATAQPRKGVIAGKVVDKATGEPLAATIEFVDLNLPKISTNPTTGVFRVPDVAEGLYTLSVQAPGHKISVEVVGVKAGEPVVKDIALIPEGKAPEAGAGDEKSRATAAAFVSMAQDKVNQRDYEEALRYLDIAGVWDPDNPQIKALYERYSKEAEANFVKNRIERGIELYNDGKFLNALAEFDKAVQKDPNSETAKKWRDMAFNALLQQQAATKPDVSRYLSEGVALYGKGDVEGAVAAWQKVLELDPNNQAAKDYITKAELKKQDDLTALIEGGRALMAKGRYSAAISDFNKALKLDPGNPEAASLKAEAQSKIRAVAKSRLAEGKRLYKAGKLDDAEAQLKSALRLDPSLSEAKTYLAKIDQDRNAAAEASKPKPMGDVNALYLKGVEAYVKEDYETAIYYWSKVLEIDPQHSKARKNLARAKQKMGK